MNAQGFEGLNFALVDARSMRPKSFPSPEPLEAAQLFKKRGGRYFDICVDKGLVDGLWCSGLAGTAEIGFVSKSVASCLKPGGRWLTLSKSSPEMLQHLLLEGSESSKSHLYLWNGFEARRLQELYLYVLERSNRPFREDAKGDVDFPNNWWKKKKRSSRGKQ